MHEFSIAVSIVELAEAEARKAEAFAVSELVLDIGSLSGIEYDALDTALEMAVRHTMLENCRLVVNKIAAMAKCRECQHEFAISQVYDPCPQCNSPFHDILRGKELQIKSLVVETPD